MSNIPYERNEYLINSPTNLTIGEIKNLSRADFDSWAEKFRKEVTYAWDVLGIPVKGGKNADGIVSDFKSLANYDVKRIERADETTGEVDCVINPHVGSSCTQFFPTILKTTDISTGSLDGPSIYKYFADDDYEEQFKKFAYKLFHRERLKAFDDIGSRVSDHTAEFRTCFPVRPAGNFPPAIAKYIYLRFTDHIEDQDRVTIYDPCSGWGGRILGAMSCCDERKVHYVGTDPNPDHWMPDLAKTKYAYVADYFNGNVRGQFKNTYEMFQSGSEVISDEKEFQKYKGEMDLVFTSPPYFAAEGYSEDENQSYKKFQTYEDWRDGYLKRTLEISVDYLKGGRWLIWNIADVIFASDYLPMESDTIKILENLGLEYRGKLKMILASAPGGSKENEDGVPRTKNFCRVDGKVVKYEPILMFWKPAPEKVDVDDGWVPSFDDLILEQDIDEVDLTPIERHGEYWVKRDDLFEIAGIRGGKARSCWNLAQGATGLTTAGSRSSPQVNIVAHVAAELGIDCRCHVPSGQLSPELEAAKDIGAEIVQHIPGHNNVIIARAREDAAARNWVEIPFGMECEEAVYQTSAQVSDLPDGINRIVVPVGSGMSLAGVLHGLREANLTIPVLGVRVGADPMKRLNKYAPSEWASSCELVKSGVDYHEEVYTDFPIKLDPIYEGKCVKFLEPNDLLWIVGIRESEAV
jgi:1-aminocyclopropane-1-carboxylate deaminase/D-cysteine desulfhydrase-like pyridoxal-dependent ACC family enzyme